MSRRHLNKFIKAIRRGRGSGRNNQGRLCNKYHGGGEKNKIFNISNELKTGAIYRVIQETHYRNRRARVAWVKEVGGIDDRLITLGRTQKQGDIIRSIIEEYPGQVLNDGDEVKIRQLRPGEKAFNVDGIYARGAAAYAVLKSRNLEAKTCTITVKSGKDIEVPETAKCRVGVSSSWVKPPTNNKCAGRNRRLGIRPRVNVHNKNAVDR